MTTDKTNSPLPAPIDVTDPWRGLYQATRLPAPTEYGDIAHPDIPCWPDDREDALDKLVQAQGFDFQVVAGEFTEAALEEGDELYWAEMRAWTPVAPPEGEWRLAWKGDTEDGPYAWFVRPMALRPEPVALTATGKQQVGEVQGDALLSLRRYRMAFNTATGEMGLYEDDTGSYVKLQDVERALAVTAAPQRTDAVTPAMVDAACKVIYADWLKESKKAYRDVCREEMRVALQAALAARQPGAQPCASHCQNGRADICLASQRDGVICPDDSCDIDDGIRHDRPVSAPPAQGIDLAQFRELVELLVDHSEKKLTDQQFMLCGKLLNLIDGRRDTAPGVAQ